jgi:D-3-phosphoglycerate dehydrogenase
MMRRFKVALVDFDGNPVAGWVGEAFAKEGIDFVARVCQTGEELARHAGDADVVWVFGSHVITAESLAALPQCGAIIRTGSGTDNVPVEEATRRGIVVANTPEAHSDAVSNHAIGLLFAVIRQIAVQDRAVRSGEWSPARGTPGWHLHGQTLGLVGFGHAARLVAKKMSGFDMTLVAHDPYLNADVMAREGVRAANLDGLLSESDFVFLHCPLTQGTYHLIGARELRLMKPSSILINTARGAVIDEPALVQALTEGWIAAAGLDVLEQEPPSPNHPLFELSNVVITPHLAGYSDEHKELTWRLSVESAIALAQGRWPRSCVNRAVKPRWNLS